MRKKLAFLTVLLFLYGTTALASPTNQVHNVVTQPGSSSDHNLPSEIGSVLGVNSPILTNLQENDRDTETTSTPDSSPLGSIPGSLDALLPEPSTISPNDESSPLLTNVGSISGFPDLPTISISSESDLLVDENPTASRFVSSHSRTEKDSAPTEAANVIITENFKKLDGNHFHWVNNVLVPLRSSSSSTRNENENESIDEQDSYPSLNNLKKNHLTAQP